MHYLRKNLPLVAIGAAVAVALLGMVPVADAQGRGDISTVVRGLGTSTSLAQGINCTVFGILAQYGIMPNHFGANCGDQPPPPPPPPPPQNGTLIVVKNVSGGTSTPAMFNLHVSASGTSTKHFVGSGSGTSVQIPGGASYSVTEDASANHTASFSTQCSGTMPSGGIRTCVVTNTFTGTTTPPAATSSLRIIKVVNGGTATSSDFTLNLKMNGSHVSGSPQAGTVSGTLYTNLANGTYVVSETGGPSGYSASFSGDCNSAGSVTLSGTSTRTCTVTNTFSTSTATTTGSIRIIKNVVGGTATSSDFQLHLRNLASSTEVSGSPQAGSAGGTTYTGLAAGVYTIWETGAATTSHSVSFSGDCTSSGTLTLSGTSTKTCTVTNTFTGTTSTTTVDTADLLDQIRRLLSRLFR